jgi:hypothetical protein
LDIMLTLKVEKIQIVFISLEAYRFCMNADGNCS